MEVTCTQPLIFHSALNDVNFHPLLKHRPTVWALLKRSNTVLICVEWDLIIGYIFLLASFMQSITNAQWHWCTLIFSYLTHFFIFSNIFDVVITFILYLSRQFWLLFGWNSSLIETTTHVGWTSIKIDGNPFINCRLDVNQNVIISVLWALGPYFQWIVWMLFLGSQFSWQW